METPVELLTRGVEEGLHPGAQLAVVHKGKVVLDFACGEARPGVPMGTDSIVQWYSSGKPLTAVAIAKLHENGQLDIESPVSTVIPEFAEGGKGPITFRHLLTHTAGFRSADKLPPDLPWREMIDGICAAPMEPDWMPGEKAGYSTQASWFILAEAIHRVTGRAYDECMHSEMRDQLGMSDSWVRLPFSEHKKHGGRIAFMYNSAGKRRDPLPLQDAEGMAICRPGASARGPIRELAAFYSKLLDGTDGYLKPETISWMTERHRAGLYDYTFMHTLDFGLGFIINSNRYGANTVPYGYGTHASEAAFGHSGAQSSCAFADPAHNLAVAWVCNGQPGEREHQQRQRALNTAIYEYLSLSPTGGAAAA